MVKPRLKTGTYWKFVLEYPGGLNGETWDIFHSLHFRQKEVKDELLFVIEEIKYRPGDKGYNNAKYHFKTYIS